MPSPRRAVAILVATFALAAVPVRAGSSAETCFAPTRTWVVVVGVLDYLDRDAFAQLPSARRRDRQIVEHFIRLGVPKARIAYLADEHATARRVSATLSAVAAAAGPADTLFFYFAGHGYLDDDGRGYFATYDADADETKGWATRSIVTAIDRNFHGARVVLVADACSSGSLVDEVRRRGSRVPYAVLCSAQRNETATANWTFTDTLLDGLRGSAYQDADGDGTISVGELVANERTDLALGEEQLPSFVTTSGFDLRTPVAVSRPKLDARIGRRVEVDWDGETYRARIVDARGTSVRLHVIGDDTKDDWWVAARDVRSVEIESYPVGTRVMVESDGDWYPAHVRETTLGVHLVSFDGYDRDADEWVTSDRIRERRGRR